MPDKPKASKALGLELTSKELKCACLVYKNRKHSIEQLFSLPIAIESEPSAAAHVKPLYTAAEEKNLHSIANKRLVVSALPTKDLLIRQLTLPLTKEKDIDAVIEFQSEPLLPYPIEEGFIDKLILEKGAESSKAAIGAAKIEQVSLHLELWQSLGIEPEVVGCTPAALAAFAVFFHKAELPFLHLHLGDSETTCILVSKGRLFAAQSVQSGIAEWIACIRHDRRCSEPEAAETIKTVDFGLLSKSDFPSLSEHLIEYRLEITRLIFALRKQAQNEFGNEILVTGEGASLIGAPQFLCKDIQASLVMPMPAPGFPPAEELSAFAVSIGMALTALPKMNNQMNFRQKSLAYPYPLKRIKTPLAAYIAACLLLTAAIYLFGNAYIGSTEDRLKKDYVDLLALMRKPYDEFELEISKKNQGGQAAPPVLSLTLTDLQSRLNLLEKDIRSTPDLFPLYPNIPKVCDVLAWLCALPLVNEQIAGEPPRIELDSFNYKMVKRPEQNKFREKYQVKVELEFIASAPRYAREFHDLLLAPNEMIDPKGDVKWGVERGKYRASFFLKDLTNYPSQ